MFIYNLVFVLFTEMIKWSDITRVLYY